MTIKNITTRCQFAKILVWLQVTDYQPEYNSDLTDFLSHLIDFVKNMRKMLYIYSH